MTSLPIPHTPTSIAFPPTTSLPPATPPRRPSPTKRAHSSPSPNSSPNPSGLAVESAAEEGRSPRVTRTKLMSYETVDGSRGSEAWLAPETPPSPAEEDVLTGLGVDMIGEDAGVGEAVGGSGPDDQTRKLMEMPAALSAALSRLSSQHHLSEYNALKRVVAAAAVASATLPPPPPIYTHLVFPPTRPVVLQRSQSTPPLTLARPQFPLPANPITQSPVSHSRIFRPFTPIANPGRTDCTGTQSVPSLSRTSTPPASPRPITTLTPSLVCMGIDSTIPTPPSRPVELAGEVKETRLAEALTEALKSEMARPVIKHGDELVAPVVKAVSAPTVGSNGLLPGMRMINGVAVKTSASHPMNLSAVVPPEFLSLLSSHHVRSSTDYPLLSTALDSHPSHTPFVLSPAPNFDLWDLIATPPSHPLLPPPPPVAGSQPALGNFFLSSCPGKKVRMDGVPVRGGRSAICRDVGMDLARAKQEGVRVIICCLNDEELGFLGAPWEEYSAAAASLSLSVIRIPMVEGFAPPSPAILDVHLTRVLRAHTLKGESVLAHCRGGIGRAGLVACCWMIKIGFVRASEGEGIVGAMKVMERVIDVIRRRRSVKAIETPHQVAFLLEYVDFLQQNASVLSAVEVA